MLVQALEVAHQSARAAQAPQLPLAWQQALARWQRRHHRRQLRHRARRHLVRR